MWIKIRKSNSEKPVIYVSESVLSGVGSQCRVHFAKRSMEAEVILLQREENCGDAFENPASFHCSPPLLEGLLLPDGCTFQLDRLNEGEIRIGPVIGLMLGEQQYYYNDKLMKEFTDSLDVYPAIGGLVFGFKCSSIAWEKEQIYGLSYNYSLRKWEYGIFPIPPVIYRRTFMYGDEEAMHFSKKYGVEIFNPRKIDKFEMYSLLKEDPELCGYLPETARLEIATLKQFLARHSKVILKPIDLSRGRGIMVIEEADGCYKVAMNQEAKGQIPWEQEIPKFLLKEYLEKDNFFGKKYLIQQYLNLSKINGSSWDIRVVMQKDSDFEWKCHGIEVRLAGPDHFVTNISTGGRALSLNTALKLMYGPKRSVRKFKESLVGVCRKFCLAMDRINPSYAEFGLDMCMDDDGKFWFIEANTRPSFNGFKTLNYKNYLKICGTPLLYAASRQKMGRRKGSGRPGSKALSP